MTRDLKGALTDKELEEILEHLSESEDNLDYSDYDVDNSDGENELFDTENIPVIFEDAFPESTNHEETTATETAEVQMANIEEESVQTEHRGNLKEIASKARWRRRSLHLNDENSNFLGQESLPQEIMDLQTPYSFFRYFFDDTLIDNIVYQSSLYSTQKDINKPANLTSESIKKYLGICIYMSLVHMPNIRSYWATNLGYPAVKDVLSRSEFERIQKFIHFADNSQMPDRNDENFDKLYKLRPIIDALNNKFQCVPLQQCLSVDEQLCSTKARHHLKQYMPAKPHKWGYKLYVLCGVDGFSHKFEIYTGRENDPKFRLENEPDLGASANTVVRLCRNVPNNKNHMVYFDNFYTSLPLVVYLAQKGIHSLGTVRRVRIPNCKLPLEHELKKTVRGTSFECVTNIEGVDVSAVVWKDNKCVTLLSSFVGKEPVSNVTRYDRKQKCTTNIECPSVIVKYNKHMGGVDLLDSLIGRYKIKIRTKKWYMRLFYHLVDVAVINGWILYKRVQRAHGVKAMRLADFRAEIAYCLCHVKNADNAPKKGRPARSSVEALIQLKKQKSATTSYIPPQDVRTDSVGHWPIHDNKRQRCKLPTCNSFSWIKCCKCGVHLCLNKHNNCFRKFHT